MTMAQGELFNGDEKTSAVSAFSGDGQSQTKEAKYHRAYRSDPKNKDRINSQKKRRRALKKESELGRVSSMFESVARPAKSEPQTVENLRKPSDSTSLPNSELQENSVCIDFTQSEILRQLSEIKGELLRQRDEIHSFVKPATPPSPIDTNNEEQQTDASDIANANLARISGTAEIEKRDFLSGVLSQLGKLDGAAFIRNFPAALALGYCAYLACGFVIDQTLPLYRSLNFPMPELACSGAIGLAIGFSALSAISKSNMAKIFIAIIAAYELILVFAGSQANQSDLASQALKSNPVHYEASETYALAKGDFERYNANYGSNNSKMFQNAWYRQNYVDPAREKLSTAVAKLKSIEEKFKSEHPRDYWVLVLKVLYRLSAVAFLMLLAKESMKRGVGALSPTATTNLY